MHRRLLMIAVVSLIIMAGCEGNGYIGSDDGRKQTEIRAGVYYTKEVEGADGSKESVNIVGPHIEVRTTTEGCRLGAGAGSR